LVIFMKNKKKKVTPKPIRTSIDEIEQSRTGGQIALSGFSYQFLYSCFLVLSILDDNTIIRFEGIEDIDHYKCEITSKTSTHIQLKFSTQKQDASFLKDVLKNFLEVYLVNSSRKFKLVYDFDVAKGNLSRILNHNLDKDSKSYWKKVIDDIKKENSSWNWNGFSFDDFIGMLHFEKQNKSTLSDMIEQVLIKNYDISTGNHAIFANALKVCCLEKMERRETINKSELETIIQNVKDDISKGPQNPAHNWIKRVSFNLSDEKNDLSYFEGKKATPQDIAMKLPVRRINTEREIGESIRNNRVTVIKASSGQGKTTLALQVAYNLCNEYSIYQLLWCNDIKELHNIVQYFKTRVKLGEKPLILIDNLDAQLQEWNQLAQYLQEEVAYNYKLLLTTREDDWYNYSGNLSNVKRLQVVKLFLNEEEAKGIFEILQKAGKLHQAITNWYGSWERVVDKKLLIEYVYLLTHGEMLSDRIANQISKLNDAVTGRVKCEILRKVCFADVCGIKISVKKLISSLVEKTGSDYGELLKSIENEFLIRVDAKEKYVEGLHPVRSQHIVDKLHEFIEINDTAIQVVQLADASYLPKLFSKLPQVVFDNKENFYSEVAGILWNADNHEAYVSALKGSLAGSVMQYYHQNQEAFDDANNHGGLFLLATELNPFTKFKEFGYALQTLDDLKKITPDNANIQYLCNLRDSATKIRLSETDIYYFSKAIFKIFEGQTIIQDIPSFAMIAYWLLNIDSSFNIASKICLDDVWVVKDTYSAEIIANIMYTCFCGNRETYMKFVKDNLPLIMGYFKRSTTSLKLYLNEDSNEIHVEYILLPSNIRKGNEESVSRIKSICKALPIFDRYCADAIQPKLDILSGYEIPDNAHKTMPIRNVIIMFHQEFASIWDKTIMSNYECASIFDWLNNWIRVRKNIVIFFESCINAFYRLLEGKPIGNLATLMADLLEDINKFLIKEQRYPNQDRPFEEKATIPEGLSKTKTDYFGSIQNFSNQLVKFIQRDKEQSRLALINLTSAQSSLEKMQKYFGDIAYEQQLLIKEHEELCILEERGLQQLMITCQYFQEHTPSKYFSKYTINSWYRSNYEKLLFDVKNTLSDLSQEFSIFFPERYYHDGILKYYPIITMNLDVMDSEALIKFLYLCTPLTEFNFDYLIIACCNKQKQIVHGIKVTMNFLKNFKTAIETEDEELIKTISLPFPEEIGKQFLDCFIEQYDLFVHTPSGYEGIDSILELLWEFSRCSKELFSESDVDYLASIKKCLEEKVFNELKTFKNKVPDDEYHELTQICEATFSGSPFDDTQLNNYYSKLISRALASSK